MTLIGLPSGIRHRAYTTAKADKAVWHTCQMYHSTKSVIWCSGTIEWDNWIRTKRANRCLMWLLLNSSLENRHLVQELIIIFPDVAKHLDASGKLHDGGKALKMIMDNKLPLDNIAHELFLTLSNGMISTTLEWWDTATEKSSSAALDTSCSRRDLCGSWADTRTKEE